MSSGARKDVLLIIESLVQQGWRVTQRGAHYRCYSPDKSQPPATVGTSPSVSALRNIVADLRQRGARL